MPSTWTGIPRQAGTAERAEANQEFIRALLRQRQPAFAAALETVVLILAVTKESVSR